MKELLQKLRVEKHNIFSILSTSAIGTTVSFVMVLAFANLVDAHVLGTYQYIISLVSLLGAFTLSGLLTSIIRALGKKEYGFLRVARKYLYLGSLPALITGTSIGGYYCFMGNIPLGVSILLGNIFYLLLQIQYRFNAIYTAIDDVKTANFFIKIFTFAPIIFVLPGLFFIKDGHVLSILFFSGSWILSAATIYLLKFQHKEQSLISQQPTEASRTYFWRKELVFGVHQSAITLLNTASVHLDKIIIFQLLGAQQTAIYFIATSIPNRFRGIVKQFESYVFARFASHSLGAVQDQLLKRFFIALILIVPLYAVYVLTAPWFFALFLPQYTDSIWLSQIYAISLFAGALIIPQSTLKAHGTARVLYINAGMFAAIKAALVSGGALYFGLTGAVAGAAIALILYTFLTLFQSLRVN